MNTLPTKMQKPATLSSSSNWPAWAALPPEITANILRRLDINDILRSGEVCSSWRSACKDPSMWRFVDLDTISRSRLGDSPDWAKVCRQIVNWSQGQLISIKLGYFATDDLLLFIALRAKKVRSLCILYGCISDEGFCKAVMEFPELEELELACNFLSKEAIKAAGHSCPSLKSFSFTKNGRHFRVPNDEEALAVAENMRGLKHLSLGGNDMSDEGVNAILDACPHLQSLNLEDCYHVRLYGDLGNRCFQQIKDLKFSPYMHEDSWSGGHDIDTEFDLNSD